jgi:glutaredoxin
MTPMTTKLSFYTTDGCHLCEQAKALLQQLLAHHPGRYQIEVIDIVISEALIEQYGHQIPVLANHKHGQAPLNWPFDYTDLLTYLELISTNAER